MRYCMFFRVNVREESAVGRHGDDVYRGADMVVSSTRDKSRA
jgi:hypothetical protein